MAGFWLQYNYNQILYKKYVSFLTKTSTFFPQPGHPKQPQPRSRKQRGNQLIPIYIYMVSGPPLFPPNHRKWNHPKPGYTLENWFYTTADTHYTQVTDTRKGHLERPRKQARPNTRVRENCVKTKTEFALPWTRQVNRGERRQFDVSPQDLLPATSLGWHKQGSFRGLLGKMLETRKTYENTYEYSLPLAVRKELIFVGKFPIFDFLVKSYCAKLWN